MRMYSQAIGLMSLMPKKALSLHETMVLRLHLAMPPAYRQVWPAT